MSSQHVMTTMADLADSFARVFGWTLDGPRQRVHPEQELADERRIDREQDDQWWRGYATPAEMNGAAADAWYGGAGR